VAASFGRFPIGSPPRVNHETPSHDVEHADPAAARATDPAGPSARVRAGPAAAAAFRGGAGACARSAPGSRANIHFCAILDFVNLCRALDIEIERSLSINPKGTKNNLRAHRLANFFGEQGMFLLRKR
jgi:hypothetical protein